MPREIYIHAADNVWIKHPAEYNILTPKTKYTRHDLAEQLAKALEFYASKSHMDENVPDGDGSVDLCNEDGEIARAALKQFREEKVE